jgi:hypothetical protein
MLKDMVQTQNQFKMNIQDNLTQKKANIDN